MDLNSETEAAAIADLALRTSHPTTVDTPDGRRFLVVHSDMRLQEITDPHGTLPAKSRIVQGVDLQKADSLVDYLNRFKEAQTSLFADIDANRIVAIVDYHGPAAPASSDHVALLDLPFSQEWIAWKAIDGKLMSQLDFARFVEENSADFLEPQAADLLEVCRDIQAIRKVDFRAGIRTATDNMNFEYTDETTATSKGLEIPRAFALMIPVYFGGRYTELRAFLRWRVDEGKLQLGVQLHRPEHVRQAIFQEIVGDVAGRTDLHAVYGKAAIA